MDSSYSIPAAEADDSEPNDVAVNAVGIVSLLPGWKSNDEHVLTRLFAAVRSRKQRSWHLANTCNGGDESRNFENQ